MKKFILTLAAVAALVSCKNEPKTETEETPVVVEEPKTPEQEVAYKIAEANGLANWDKVSELDFTFNVDRGDSHFVRAWKWNPNRKLELDFWRWNRRLYTYNSRR